MKIQQIRDFMNVIAIECRCCFACLYVDNYIWLPCINGTCRCVCKQRERDRQTEKRGKGERILLFLYDFEKDIIKIIILWVTLALKSLNPWYYHIGFEKFEPYYHMFIWNIFMSGCNVAFQRVSENLMLTIELDLSSLQELVKIHLISLEYRFF